jgi:AbiV family abortive infection protein
MVQKHYQKTLGVEQVFQGSKKALANAAELVRDATILYRNKSWARSVFLCQIAGEEMGKYIFSVSACVGVITDTIDWNRFWKNHRNHTDKTSMIMFVEIMTLARSFPAKELKELDSNCQVYEQGKLMSLYCDIYENGFHRPSELFNKTLVSQALRIARGRLRLIKEFDKESPKLQKLKKLTRQEVHKMLEETGAPIQVIQRHSS